jgi:hypothetical protein
VFREVRDAVQYQTKDVGRGPDRPIAIFRKTIMELGPPVQIESGFRRTAILGL